MTYTQLSLVIGILSDTTELSQTSLPPCCSIYKTPRKAFWTHGYYNINFTIEVFIFVWVTNVQCFDCFQSMAIDGCKIVLLCLWHWHIQWCDSRYIHVLMTWFIFIIGECNRPSIVCVWANWEEALWQKYHVAEIWARFALRGLSRQVVYPTWKVSLLEQYRVMTMNR